MSTRPLCCDFHALHKSANIHTTCHRYYDNMMRRTCDRPITKSRKEVRFSHNYTVMFTSEQWQKN